jgi:hypothetical protein
MYLVIADDGNRYGPADLVTLNAWIAEGRLQPTTMLEHEQSGERRPAASVPGLNFPNAQPGDSTGASRGQAYQGQGYAAQTDSGPNVGTPYPRASDGGPEAQKLVKTAWICGVLGLCCCFLIPIYGIIKANEAEQLGASSAKVARWFCIAAVVLKLGGGVLTLLSVVVDGL